ncbi:Hypothetical protein FKW44_002574 [Caligus rogercresseyi]|uniref:Uncharacterized protein n=1 Tax=Caligus rogercresseyi TaxID=217165 RepID=A0A7T8KKT5_CALRO|nr:Hypothetical protein FKW44_002574 [Caligus rogercresseyi]
MPSIPSFLSFGNNCSCQLCRKQLRGQSRGPLQPSHSAWLSTTLHGQWPTQLWSSGPS